VCFYQQQQQPVNEHFEKDFFCAKINTSPEQLKKKKINAIEKGFFLTSFE
jgi:hypothetical protein